jgi:uncharacterized integral membrane protein (TIGR00698 family)
MMMRRISLPSPPFGLRSDAIARAVPGVALAIVVALAACALESIERTLVGTTWIEALVMAIVLGAALRSAGLVSPAAEPGIAVAAKPMLEIAIVLMGASLSFGDVARSGVVMPAAIAGIVAMAIVAGVAIGRWLGLPPKMALLVACGNAICGNSAIAAVAPVIDADSDDVAAAIGFAAVLGVVVVLAMPALAALAGLKDARAGALAGLTVYAVPQVLAAAAPMGAVAVQSGTLVKLMRVLMLGPVCVALTIVARRRGWVCAEAQRTGPSIGQFVPWFIIGFVALAALRSLGLFPDRLAADAAALVGPLTVMAMAGLGLGVDVRSVRAAGPRVTAAVVLSLVVLGGLSVAVMAVITAL